MNEKIELFISLSLFVFGATSRADASAKAVKWLAQHLPSVTPSGVNARILGPMPFIDKTPPDKRRTDGALASIAVATDNTLKDFEDVPSWLVDGLKNAAASSNEIWFVTELPAIYFIDETRQ